jgi:hypothetical protein
MGGKEEAPEHLLGKIPEITAMDFVPFALSSCHPSLEI